ncbi:MAG: hypothetical protein ACM3N3_14960 [Betaproteobacteria bacterium]
MNVLKNYYSRNPRVSNFFALAIQNSGVIEIDAATNGVCSRKRKENLRNKGQSVNAEIWNFFVLAEARFNASCKIEIGLGARGSGCSQCHETSFSDRSRPSLYKLLFCRFERFIRLLYLMVRPIGPDSVGLLLLDQCTKRLPDAAQLSSLEIPTAK